MQEYFSLLTATGANLLINAVANKTPVKLSKIAVSDSEIAPSEAATELENTKHEFAINSLTQDPQNPSILNVEGVIPSNVGGFNIRKFAIFTQSGEMFAVGRVPLSYKPALNQGAGSDLVFKIRILIGNVSNIELKVDNSVALATRDWAKKTFQKLTDAIDAYNKQESDERYLEKTEANDFALKRDIRKNLVMPYITYDNETTLQGNELKIKALVPFAKGIDELGLNTDIKRVEKSIDLSALTLKDGDNYLYLKEDGSYYTGGAIPKILGHTNNRIDKEAVVFDTLKNKWFYNKPKTDVINALVMAHLFEDTSGKEYFNKYNTPKIGNPTLEDSPYGKCVKFTTGNYFNWSILPINNEIPNQADSYCIELDFMSEAFVTSHPSIASFFYGYIVPHDASSLGFYLINSAGYVQFSVPYNYQEWSKLVINATPQSIDIYKNGVKIHSQPNGNKKYVRYSNTNGAVFFGGTAGGNMAQFNGKIAKFLQFNRALTEQEISKLDEIDGNELFKLEAIEPLNAICNLKKTAESVVLAPLTNTANIINQSLGVGQEYKNLIGQRRANEIYTNDTGRPIYVNIGIKGNGPGERNLKINGVIVDTAAIGAAQQAPNTLLVKGIVPAGATYSVDGSVNFWFELR
nr:MAG TPA: tail collar fiber protein [Caudoviricetes sp.]